MQPKSTDNPGLPHLLLVYPAEAGEELVGCCVSVLWDENKWYRGSVVGYDGFMHTGEPHSKVVRLQHTSNGIYPHIDVLGSSLVPAHMAG
jgi:hypothetical protein